MSRRDFAPRGGGKEPAAGAWGGKPGKPGKPDVFDRPGAGQGTDCSLSRLSVQRIRPRVRHSQHVQQAVEALGGDHAVAVLLEDFLGVEGDG